MTKIQALAHKVVDLECAGAMTEGHLSTFLYMRSVARRAEAVVASWESGDLAASVRSLSRALGKLK